MAHCSASCPTRCTWPRNDDSSALCCALCASSASCGVERSGGGLSTQAPQRVEEGVERWALSGDVLTRRRGGEQKRHRRDVEVCSTGCPATLLDKDAHRVSGRVSG